LEVVEEFEFGRLGDPNELCKILVFESTESFGDIPRSRPGRVSDLPQKIELLGLPDAKAEGDNSAPQLIRQLPRREFAKRFEARHGASKCKRRPVMKTEDLGLIRWLGDLQVAIFLMRTVV
jgi:hypothetical protein